ncbi:hypothetical protein LSTR_LSTR000192 [Laodelphax striatellus]|uniref:Microsomal glutathione S-transferase 1 n=1 Tax=Laodelphax striatellus TaxID=195883 RepID=A0A482X7P7_LAOST|nr:hypothetical protein LSTR_LSTR000192 [Laodelphax striatellus]
MAPLTGRYRFTKRIFANPEDKLPRSIVKYDDPDIERVRRAHLNDLENIPVFMVAALLYIATKPSYWLALNLFRTFTIARIIHTLVYAVVVIPQPARALAWVVGYAATQGAGSPLDCLQHLCSSTGVEVHSGGPEE